MPNIDNIYQETVVPGDEHSPKTALRKIQTDVRTVFNNTLFPFVNTRTVAGNAFTDDGDYILLFNISANVTLTLLPPSSMIPGQRRLLWIVNPSAHTVTLKPQGGQIDGSASVNVAGGANRIIGYDGQTWNTLLVG